MSDEPLDLLGHPGPASPPVSHDRLAGAVAELSRRVGQPELRAQLNALGALLSNLESHVASQEARVPLEAAISRAVQVDDEQGVIAAMRRLAAVDRAVLAAVDWSAVTGG